MKKAIVTGATSMLGIATVKTLIDMNYKVLAVSRKGSTRRNQVPDSEMITFVESDLSELSNIALDCNDYDVFFHFGWAYTDRSTRNVPELQVKNVQYTLDAINLAHKAGCKRFLFAGSQAEYGKVDGIINAETPVNPKVAYGICKYSAEKLGQLLCDELGIVFIGCRIFSVYGINDSENTMISYAFKQYYNKEVAQFSSGEQMWNYLNEKDAGKVFVLLGEKCETSGIKLVAHSKGKPLRDYINDISHVLGEDFRYNLAEKGNDNTISLNVDVGNLYNDIGFYPEVSFSDGIESILSSGRFSVVDQ